MFIFTKNYLLIVVFVLLFVKPCYAMQEQELEKPEWLDKTPKTILKGNVSTDANPYTGIGIVGLRFVHQTGYPTFIEEVYLNSPASKAGIKARDLIFAIDGVRTDRLSPDGVYQLLSGDPGTNVKVFITRGKSMFSAELVREDLANFSSEVQNRYLSGPIAVPFDIKDLLQYH